jgi:ubiquinone/menaquinone biosynthesis C-methylase UbiE
MAASHYIHGTHEEEQARLMRLNEIINRPAIQQMALTGGERILDIGCGLGQLTRDMARAAGAKGFAIGVERSAEQLEMGRKLAQQAGEENLVDFRQGDATSLPLRQEEWHSFDVAHTRFLLEHLPHPLEIVKSMARAVRPGGRVILQDDSHDVLRVYPEPPGFYTLWNSYIRAYDRLGNDPYIGHRLVWLLHQAGVKPRCNTWLFFGSCQGHQNFSTLARNMFLLLEGAGDRMVKEELLDQSTLHSSLQALDEWMQRPDAALWYAISWAEGHVP